MDALTRSPYVRAFDEFLYKPAYFLLIGFLTIIANFFGAELFTYTCFTVILLYLCFLGRDLLPIIPMAVCAYIAPSRANNPGRNTQSVFSMENGGIYLIILAVLMVAALVYRLIRDPELGQKAFWKTKRKLLPGMLVLCGAYLLSGLGTEQLTKVAGRNIVFALLQCAAIVALYFILTGTVKWDKAPKAYLAWTGMCVGYVLLAELIFIFLRYNIIQNGVIQRTHIYSGWGHYNNIGALLAIMIPFPFFLTGKGKYTSFFYFSGALFLGGLLFTCSRGSILCGVIAYLASYVISLLHSRHARANAVIHIVTVLVLVCIVVLFRERLYRLFQALLDRKFDPAQRIQGYIAGWKQFLSAPVFGSTFYPVDFDLYQWSSSAAFTSFFPARWHNTVIQLLASCGIVGLLAYGYHRIQTLMLFLKPFSSKKLFPLVSMLTLLLTSLLDCHFFNVGPVLFYSMMLAFVEKRLDQ